MKSNQPILLVEDDDVDILSIERAFKELNVSNPLIIRNNGEEALEYLNELDDEFPAFILLDLNMPRLSGLEFLKTYKAIDKVKWIPAIVLTTSANHRDVCEAYGNQAAGYIIKPLNFEDFKKALKEIIDYWSRCEYPDFE